MFAYMVAASKIPAPILEIGVLSDVDLPIASCGFDKAFSE